jgi:hypothetical protein
VAKNTYQDWVQEVKNNGLFLAHVPENFKTHAICQIAHDQVNKALVNNFPEFYDNPLSF